MLVDKTISEFLCELASDSPAPGGGSTAALVGALGAALCAMVMNLTRGEKYAEVTSEVEQIKSGAEKLQAKLTKYIDEDTEAFNQVMAAYRLPKNSPEEKEKRLTAVQISMKEASKLPLTVAVTCLELLEMAIRAIKVGNKNAVSDAAVAGVVAYAALHSALYNVKINLPAIKDETFVAGLRAKVTEVAKHAEELNHELRLIADQEIR